MVCLGLEPGAAGCKAQTNPLCSGGTQYPTIGSSYFCNSKFVSSFLGKNKNPLRTEIKKAHSDYFPFMPLSYQRGSVIILR